jgi:hypothetical protein
MAWYRTGTIALTNGSATVTGTGTQWVANADIGEALIAPDGRAYEITNIASDTSLTISPDYLGSTASGQAYAVAPIRGRIADLISETASLLSSFATVRDGIGSGLFPNGTVSAPALRASADQDTGLYFPSANTLGFATGGALRMTVSSAGISNGLGTVGAPSYTFTGDTNTGMWSPAADTIAFSEGGVEAMRIDSSGNVGIGTTSPGSLLTLSSSQPTIDLVETGVASADTTRLIQDASIFRIQTVNSGSFVSQDYSINKDASGATLHAWRIQNTERMRIDSSGKLLSPGGAAFVGTVATGSTNGAIIERGSNANGEYVKFADGTMICVTADITGVDVNIAAGEIFRADTIAVTLPAAFSTIASMAGSSVQIGSDNCLPGILRITAGGSNVDFRAYAPAATTNRTFRLMVVGRWF